MDGRVGGSNGADFLYSPCGPSGAALMECSMHAHMGSELCVCKLYRPLVRYVAKFYTNGSAGTLHLVQVICWKLLRNKLLSLVSIIVCRSQTPVMPLCILLSSIISQKKNGLCAKFTSKSCGIISFQY